MSILNPTTPFAPTGRTIEPDHRPDQLADAVLGSLGRTRWGYYRRPFGLIKTLLVAAPTLGLGPLLVLGSRFEKLMVVEQQQFWHLAEWYRLRTGRAEAAGLCDDAAGMGPSKGLRLFRCAAVVLAIVSLIALMTEPVFQPAHLYREVYGRSREWSWFGPYNRFWDRWTLFVSAGYFFHWIEVCWHGAKVRGFVGRFNQLTAAEGVRPVRVAEVGIGFQPLWAVIALIAAVCGIFWAIPMVMAGVVHARYASITTRQTRSDLARRVRGMLQQNRPALDVRAGRCINNKCRSFMPATAAFCPRCGGARGA